MVKSHNIQHFIRWRGGTILNQHGHNILLFSLQRFVTRKINTGMEKIIVESGIGKYILKQIGLGIWNASGGCTNVILLHNDSALHEAFYDEGIGCLLQDHSQMQERGVVGL